MRSDAQSLCQIDHRNSYHLQYIDVILNSSRVELDSLSRHLYAISVFLDRVAYYTHAYSIHHSYTRNTLPNFLGLFLRFINMFVTRSYGSYSPPKTNEKIKINKKERDSKPKQTRGFGWRPSTYDEHAALFRRTDDGEPASMPNVNSASSLPSETMVKRPVGMIPDRSQGMLAREISSHRSNPLEIPYRARSERPSHLAKRRSSRRSSKAGQEGANVHDAQALPPSMAALLAMTSIPRKKAFPPSRPSMRSQRQMSSQELVELWKQLDIDEEVAIDPTMEFLLSPPRPEDMLTRTMSNESLTHTFSRSRSCSTESMASLEGDTSASWSLPSTPASPKRTETLNGMKDRTVVIPTSIDSVIDHPLLPYHEPESSSYDDAPSSPFSSPARSPSPPNRGRRTSKARGKSSATKSALSLSIKAFRSAARSFSNFAAPSLTVLPDDHLSRGLFPKGAPTYPSEMRPKPLDGTPTAEMRRYMNPAHRLAPGDFHLHGASWDHVDLEAAAAAGIPVTALNGTKEGPKGPGVIKLQTYIRPGGDRRPSSQQHEKSSVTPSRTSTVSPFAAMQPSPESSLGIREAQPHTTPTRPRREARENADFLRVCVLEMNMRRVGKLEAVGVGGASAGRARFWLPPRIDAVAAPDGVKGGRVPKRWVAVSA